MIQHCGFTEDDVKLLKQAESAFKGMAQATGQVVKNISDIVNLSAKAEQLSKTSNDEWQRGADAVSKRLDQAKKGFEEAFNAYQTSNSLADKNKLNEASLNLKSAAKSYNMFSLNSGEKTNVSLSQDIKNLKSILYDQKSTTSDDSGKLNDEKLAEISVIVSAVEEILDKKDTSDTSSSSGGNSGDGGKFGGVLGKLAGDKALGGISKTLGSMGVFANAMVVTLGAIKNGINAILGKVTEEVNAATKLLEDKSTKQLDARLYGLLNELEGENKTNVSFIQLATDAVELIGASPLIRSQDLLNNIVTLGNQGIAFNLEQRALWETLSDKMVSTFSYTNEYLLQLIKLQQSELTDTYMGIEAAITRTLNSMYQDTQYLNSTYDSVFNSLTNALSRVGTDLGTQIAYQVELWLGSLSSLGLSDSAATSIASSINALLSGDVKNLTDQGKKLFAMAASNADISFADLLVEGVEDGKTLNTLMSSMVEVLQKIYESSEENNAVLSQWGDVFGLELSDWKAISNLTTSYLSTLTSEGMQGFNQASAMTETAFIANNLIAERTLTNERITNLIENSLFRLGFDIATDEQDFITWKLAEAAKRTSAILFGSDSDVTDIINLVGTFAQGLTLIGNLHATLTAIKDEIPNLLSTEATMSQFFTSSDTGKAGIEVIAQLFRMNADGNNYVDLDSSALKSGSYSDMKYLRDKLKNLGIYAEVQSGINYDDMTQADAVRLGTYAKAHNMTLDEAAEALKVNGLEDSAYEYKTVTQPTKYLAEQGWELVQQNGKSYVYKRLKDTSEVEAQAEEAAAPIVEPVAENVEVAEALSEVPQVETAEVEANIPSATPTANPSSGGTSSTTAKSTVAYREAEEQNQDQKMSQYKSAAVQTVSNTLDEETNHTTYDISDLYLLVSSNQGANVRLVGIDPAINFNSTVTGNLSIDNGSLDGKIRSTVQEIIT